MGPDGTAHGFPLAGAVSAEAAPKVTARLGRDLTELPLPPSPAAAWIWKAGGFANDKLLSPDPGRATW